MLSWIKKHLKTSASFDGPRVDTHTFELQLSSSWKSEESDDPEQFLFNAKDGSSLTVSSMDWHVPADRLHDAAEVMIKARMKAITEELGGEKYEFRSINYVPVPYPGLEIYYDGTAQRFNYCSSFYGLMTENFMFSLYVASPGKSPEHNAAMLRSVMEGLGLKIPMPASDE
jgi:hypothetical protein